MRMFRCKTYAPNERERRAKPVGCTDPDRFRSMHVAFGTTRKDA